jgi:hypothetical protein
MSIYDDMPDGKAQAEYNTKRLAELEATARERQARMALVTVQPEYTQPLLH